jgi:HEAT repeat protein
LKKLKETRDVDGLIIALTNPDLQVQYEAAEALGNIGDEKAVGPLIAALKCVEFSGVRWKAAEALSKIGDPAVEPLIAVLQHPDEDVRWKAAIALGEIGNTDAIEPLIALLRDDDRFVRSRAAHALGMIGEPAVNRLIEILHGGDGDSRWGAVMALGQSRDPRAVEPLIVALADTHGDVRAEAAAALAAIGRPAVEPLIRFLKYTHGAARAEVVTALGELHDAEAIEPLVQILENADEGERRAVAEALNAFLIPAVEPLVLRLVKGKPQKNKKTRSKGNNGAE